MGECDERRAANPGLHRDGALAREAGTAQGPGAIMSRKRSKTMLADFLRRYMPTREQMEKSRWLAPIAHRFLSPELWRFTRRSVPRGVALGLFAGFIVPVGQIFLAAFLALPARANVPLAAAVTFVTNPFTLPFWLVVANKLGRFVLKLDAVAAGGAAQAEIASGRWQGYGWFLQTAGATAFGFLVMSVISAALAYVISGWVWRVVVARKWNRRPHRFLRRPAE
jgi:uncharacterized protein